MHCAVQLRYNAFFEIHTMLRLAVSSVVSVREISGSISGLVKSAQFRQRLATAATFLRSCVAQALSREDGPRHSLHALASYCEYNEDLIFDIILLFFIVIIGIFILLSLEAINALYELAYELPAICLPH